MCSILLASSEVMEFQITEAFCILYTTKVNYNVTKGSREEEQKVTMRTKAKNLIELRKYVSRLLLKMVSN
jgi:hypothetical protein